MNATRQNIKAKPMPAIVPMTGRVLQRKCACGNHCAVGECGGCKANRLSLQRSGGARNDMAEAPPIVHEVLRSPGQPLDRGTRALLEPRFGQDFSHVRLHTDSRAAESAQAVNASAYTVGRHVAFGAGQYAPGTRGGAELLAHELAHVVQQEGTLSTAPPALAPADDSAERQADAVANRVAAGGTYEGTLSRTTGLRRKIMVDKSKDAIPRPGGKGIVKTNAQTIADYLTTLCGAGAPTVDSGTGAVGIGSSFCTRPQATLWGVGMPWTTASPAEQSKTPAGCGCICDLVNSAHVWTIRVDDASWPHTVFDDDDAANGKKPGGTGGMVFAPSPNSPKLWGAATASGKELNIDPWLVLGHELCGHGWLGNFGRHGPDETKPRGEGGHQETVARENLLRQEHGIELRGTFKQPNCGESFWRDKSAPGTVNWSFFHAVCQAWRNRYNAAHGTKYKITDTIP